MLPHRQGTSSEAVSPGLPWPERLQGSRGLLEQRNEQNKDEQNEVASTQGLPKTTITNNKIFMAQNKNRIKIAAKDYFHYTTSFAYALVLPKTFDIPLQTIIITIVADHI